MKFSSALHPGGLMAGSNGYSAFIRNLTRILYFLFCSGIIGLPRARVGQLYLTVLLLLVAAIYLASARANLRKLPSPDRGPADRWRMAPFMTAAWAGVLVNIIGQIASLQYHIAAIPNESFAAGYCMLFLILSPLPFLPGDVLYYRVPPNSRVIIFLALAVSSLLSGRMGMMIPALYMYIDIGSPLPTDQASADERLSGKGDALSMSCLSVVLALGLALSSK